MNNQLNKYEDLEICKKCGGYCCKKSGCDYFVSDLESMKLEYLENLLDSGRVSIIATFNFRRLITGKLTYKLILSLRARNINRGAIDLLSFKTQCASLTENGCYYDINTRPGGGAALIPCADKPCYSEVDRIGELYKWIPYQNILKKLIKKKTNMSVKKKLEQDIETLVYDIITENYKDSSKSELKDIASMLPLLKECFPNEFNSAIKKYNELSKKTTLIRKKKGSLSYE